MHALAHFAVTHTKIFRAILIEQSELSFRKKGFPFGAMAIQIASMLVNFYQFGILRREPRLVKYLFGPDPSELFYKLYDIVLISMNVLWRRAEYTLAQLLQAVRNMKYVVIL